ncbi:MAG TPA: EF-hand domain-containing protein, partial [Gemmataceae bacterium]|nr:EF-hand domain-containing protein [Gemmataceae bacterium]
TTPDQEEKILVELRRAYERQSAEQEERLFREIRRNGTLPVGTVPVGVQFEQAKKLFTRFDLNADGTLNADEMPDGLWKDWRRWDRNRDGVIDFDEYGAYYRGNLDWVSEKVAAGEITLKLPKSMTGPTPKAVAQVAPAEKGAPALPAWFADLDGDRDGQIGLYEWRAAGRPIAEFLAMDLDGDGLLPPAEYLRFVRQSRLDESRANPTTESAVKLDAKASPPVKRK